VDTKRHALLSSALYGILFLFFFQLIADFIEAVYAFGLLGTRIPVEVVSVILLFSPALLLLVRRGLPDRALFLLGQGILVSRVAEAMLDTRGRMIVSGLGVACFLIFLPAWLGKLGEQQEAHSGSLLSAGLAVGILLAVLLKGPGAGFDLSTDHELQGIGWLLGAVASVLLFLVCQPERMVRAVEPGALDEGASTSRTLGLALGLTSGLLMCYLAFAAPNVIARWTGESSVVVVGVMVAALSVFALLTTLVPRLATWMTCRALVTWNALFVLALVSTILAHQIRFPPDPNAYPLPEPPATVWQHLLLVLTLALFPVIVVDLRLYARDLVRARPSLRKLGLAFAVCSLFLFLVVLAQILTTVYDYVPVVGPLLRNRFWLVYLVVGAALTLPMLLVQPRGNSARLAHAERWMFPAAVAALSLAASLGWVMTAARPAAQPEGRDTVRICTYNIQQGYDEWGQKNYDGQLELLRHADADIIGLQESDTNRIAGGNADIVGYLASKLNLYSYYGPKTVPGTFGIALLSRYPIDDPRTLYLYSEGEQTAMIEAKIRVGTTILHVVVTHLGNDGPMAQQQAVLKAVAGQKNVVLMGDFNFEPDTAQYRLTTEALVDAWLQQWPWGVDGQGKRFDQRIDHIFATPGTAINDAEYITAPESDHPALVAEMELR